MSESYSLISAREHYLMQPVVDAFTDYLAEYIAGRVFDPTLLKPIAQRLSTVLRVWRMHGSSIFRKRQTENFKIGLFTMKSRSKRSLINVMTRLLFKS